MNHKAFLIIDLQNAVFDGKQIPPAYQAERLLQNVSSLLGAARGVGIPVIHVQHCAAPGEALEEGTPGWPIYAPLAPQGNEPVVRKRFSSAFEETDLHATLQRLEVRSLIVAGIQSEHCVAATCRAALTLGYDVQLAEDGHSTWPENDRSAEEIIASQNENLRSRGVALHRAAELIAAIVEECDHDTRV